MRRPPFLAGGLGPQARAPRHAGPWYARSGFRDTRTARGDRRAMKRMGTVMAVLLALAAPALSAPESSPEAPVVPAFSVAAATASVEPAGRFRDDGDKESLLLAIDRQRAWL